MFFVIIIYHFFGFDHFIKKLEIRAIELSHRLKDFFNVEMP
jgi:hypothetical protein